MGDEDIALELFAEKNADPRAWDQPVKIRGRCKIGCKGRGMLDTTNLVTALNWVEYHREGFEHINTMLERAPLMIAPVPGE